jgi:hypothetical protein
MALENSAYIFQKLHPNRTKHIFKESQISHQGFAYIMQLGDFAIENRTTHYTNSPGK